MNKPTLHQLALALNIPYARLANAQVAYKPQVGQPYNAKEINWEAVDAFVTRRLDKTDFTTLDDLYAAANEVEYTPKTRARKEGSVWGQMLFGTTPVRKGNVQVGTLIKNKKDPDILGTVVYADETIVCYNKGTGTVTQAIGNRVFNNQFEIVTADNTEVADETFEDIKPSDVEEPLTYTAHAVVTK